MRLRPGAAAALASILGMVAPFGLIAGCRKRALLSRGEGAAVVVVDGAVRHEVFAPPTQGEVEPNARLGEAQAVSLGGQGAVVAGTLSLDGAKSGDVDIFRIHLAGLRPDAGAAAIAAVFRPDASPSAASERQGVGPDGQTLPVHAARIPERHVGFFLELAGQSEPGARLDVLDGEGELIQGTSARAGRVGIPNLAIFPEHQTVLVRVSRGRVKASSPTKATAASPLHDAGAVRELAYRLTITPQPYLPGDELEPNGDAAHATEIVVDTSRGEAAGWCGSRGDIDWFVVDGALVPPEGGLLVEIDIPAGVTARLRVVDEGGRTWLDSGATRGRVRPKPAYGPLPLPNGDQDRGAPPTAPGWTPAPTRLWLSVKTESGFALDERYVLRVRGVIAEVPPE